MMTVQLLTSLTTSPLLISLHFLTMAPNGTLFQLSGTAGTSDFIRVFTNRGLLMSSFRLGGGTTTVMSMGVYDDGQWHVIRTTVSNQTLQLMVDDVLLVGYVIASPGERRLIPTGSLLTARSTC